MFPESDGWEREKRGPRACCRLGSWKQILRWRLECRMFMREHLGINAWEGWEGMGVAEGESSELHAGPKTVLADSTGTLELE